MNNTKDSLGNRMKDNYESVSNVRLIRRMPVVIRLDGCAFHTFTKHFKKPFDPLFSKAMQETMLYLCKNIQGCVLGYTQSDEITLVLVDYQNLQSDAWFDYRLQKIVSVSASMATLKFNEVFNQLYLDKVAELTNSVESEELDQLFVYDKARRKGAYFDARAFNIPKEEVANCLFWRQLDAERNSILSLAQTFFTSKQMHGISCHDLVVKLEEEKGVIWGNLPTIQKRGSCAHRVGEENKLWLIDAEIPRFKDEGRLYIEQEIYFNE